MTGGRDVLYTTREQVKHASDQQGTARSDAEIDRAMLGAYSSVNALCRRKTFAPYVGTELYDYPQVGGRAGRLYLDDRSLIELTGITVGGTSRTVSEVTAYPLDGPPYEWIETNDDASFSFGDADDRRGAVGLVGTHGHSDGVFTAIGTLVGGINASVTSIAVSAPAAAALGVGSLLQVGSELLVVTGRGFADTTVNLATPMTASAAGRALVVADGSAFAVGEWVVLDTEVMVIERITGNTLSVRRAIDGSVLADHTGSDIYAQRLVTVTRGARGSTAAAHLNGDSVELWSPPPLVGQLALAETLVTLGMQQRAYASSMPKRPSGKSSPPPGGGIDALREQVRLTYGRPVLYAAVGR